MQVQRVRVDSHVQSSMRLHLDLACVKLINTEVKLKDIEAKLNDTDAKLNDAHFKLNETKVKLSETEKKLEATRKEVENTRMFTWRIDNFSVILRLARAGVSPSKESVPFYTDRTESYGYKLKVRFYPLTLSVCTVVMKGEYDAILPWPFKNKVTFSLIDQQEDPVKRQNITNVIFPCYEPDCFARPVKEENNGFVIFFNIDQAKFDSRRYLVDDTLFIQVEISPP